MKKEKTLSPAKAAKKKAKETIETSLINTFKSITAGIGHAVIDIEKEAKKLAKKITKGLKPAKAATPAKAESPKKEKSAAKPAEVKAVKAPVAKTETAKPATPAVKKPVAKVEAAKPVVAAAKKPVAKPEAAKPAAAKVVKAPVAKAVKK